MKHRLWHTVVITIGLYLLFVFHIADEDISLSRANPNEQFQQIFSRLLP
ncbi:MAG: hypothetical protein AAGA83_02330 [Cyanobacteria bacterium P01_F01_bin.116]